MKFKCFMIFSFWILQNVQPGLGFEILAMVDRAFRIVSEQIYTSFQNIMCPFDDCCSDYWIPADIKKLNRLLDAEVFGQHIATEIISKQLKAHLTNDFPAKPLVMSFHGWTGNGKNHVAYLIAKSLYRNGIHSHLYHHFMATVHFPHQDQAAKYQDQIRNWVRGNVSLCARSLFVFDEVDKMPNGVLDGIRAFLDYIEAVDKVDYRKSIFIFLSNTGGKEITKKVHEAWLSGKQNRNSLTIRDFERLIESGAFNEEGSGLYQSRLIDKSLIDVYVPFLPMEKVHVKLCAQNELKKHNHKLKDKETALMSIVNGLSYYPEDMELYSVTGCKRIAQKVSIYITNERLSSEFDDEGKDEL